MPYNLIEDLNSLIPMTEQQYRFWNSMHVVIRKLLHFALLHYALEKLLLFALKDYYILNWKFYNILRQCYYILRYHYILRRFSLHFAAIITFCGVTHVLLYQDRNTNSIANAFKHFFDNRNTDKCNINVVIVSNNELK